MSPFNKVRYEHLLEGLEVSVLALSDVIQDNEKLRLDSAYFGKDVRRLDAAVRAHSTGSVELGDIVQTFRKGIFDIKAETYVDSGVPFIRISNLKNGSVDEAGIAFIDPLVHAAESNTRVVRGDLAISKTAYPAAAYVQIPEANVSQDVIACSIATKWKEKINSGYLAAYLNSRVGLALMQRQFQGNVQLHLSLDDGKKIPIPLLQRKLQDRIEQCFRDAFEYSSRGEDLLAKAEQTLLNELGLADWTPLDIRSFVSSSHAVTNAERFDAEYFNPAKVQILAKLASMPGQPLRDRIKSVRNTFDPKKPHTPFETRNFDLPDALQPVLDSTKEVVWSDEIGSTKKLFNPGDVVISRLRSYLREIAVIRTGKDQQSMGSTEFIVLRPPKNGITAETLWAYLRSAPVQTVLRWCVDGSQHPRFSEDDLLDIYVPDAVLLAGPKIDATFRSATEAKQRARQLLDATKRAVEIAVEDGEVAALKFLEKV